MRRFQVASKAMKLSLILLVLLLFCAGWATAQIDVMFYDDFENLNDGDTPDMFVPSGSANPDWDNAVHDPFTSGGVAEIAIADENRLRAIIVAAKSKERTDAVEAERVEGETPGAGHVEGRRGVQTPAEQTDEDPEEDRPEEQVEHVHRVDAAERE